MDVLLVAELNKGDAGLAGLRICRPLSTRLGDRASPIDHPLTFPRSGRVAAEVTVEAMDIDDLPAERFADALRLWADADLTRPWNDAEQDLRRAVAGSGSTVLAAVVEGVLVGTVMVGHDGHRGWVYYLAVAEERRGSGIGRTLMQAAENWVADRGVPKLQLLVRTENEVALDFYTRLGYEQGNVVMLGRRLNE